MYKMVFTPGGNLAVADADRIIPTINQLAGCFENVVLTQDWHPDNHISFAANHLGNQPFETIELDYGPQVLWLSIVYKVHKMPSFILI